MTHLVSEAQLARVAAGLAGGAYLTSSERRLVKEPKPDAQDLRVIQGFIKAGLDPLGEAFEQIRSPERRRRLGAVYTPAAIVQAMVDWAAAKAAPARIVDAGAGSGRYLVAAARRWPKAKLIACEIDPLAALVIRANAAVLGFQHRLELYLGDYREMPLPRIRGKTLFIGNPPYVRHHDIAVQWKRWFKDVSKKFGFKSSSLAGLHTHFFLRTRELAHTGDYGCFITSSEWLDVNYGTTIREMLGDGLGGASLHLIDSQAMPFGQTMTTGAITCFEVGSHSQGMGVQTVEKLSELSLLTSSRSVSWTDLQAAKRWSVLVRSGPRTPSGMLEIGDLFRVKRGYVTGNNKVWVEGCYPGTLPLRYLVPAVTRAKEIIESHRCLSSSPRPLRRVIFLPRDLNIIDARERELILDFLKWARRQDADQSYTARSRSPWWHIARRAPPAILATYMGRRSPSFVRNDVDAQYLNIALGLYPLAPLSTADLDAVVRYLDANVCRSFGRTYAGGLVKFEPGELESVPMPSLEDLRERTTALDARGNRRRGEGSPLPISS